MAGRLGDEARRFFQQMEEARDAGRISEAEYEQRCKEAYAWLHRRGFSFLWREGELPSWAEEAEHGAQSSLVDAEAQLAKKLGPYSSPN
jgi:hypothetical protein